MILHTFFFTCKLIEIHMAFYKHILSNISPYTFINICFAVYSKKSLLALLCMTPVKMIQKIFSIASLYPHTEKHCIHATYMMCWVFDAYNKFLTFAWKSYYETCWQREVSKKCMLTLQMVDTIHSCYLLQPYIGIEWLIVIGNEAKLSAITIYNIYIYNYIQGKKSLLSL